VAKDDMGGTAINQLRGADITGEGARFGMVAILSANGQWSSQANRAMYQRRRWT
jgi:hypothetical protein